jgi:hypothetical protein
MLAINTNTKALFSQNALKVSGKLQAKSMEQLSTGKRINTAGDDAAGGGFETREESGHGPGINHTSSAPGKYTLSWRLP